MFLIAFFNLIQWDNWNCGLPYSYSSNGIYRSSDALLQFSCKFLATEQNKLYADLNVYKEEACKSRLLCYYRKVLILEQLCCSNIASMHQIKQLLTFKGRFTAFASNCFVIVQVHGISVFKLFLTWRESSEYKHSC